MKGRIGLLVVLAANAALGDTKKITNEDVLRMLDSTLAESTIVQLIEAAESDFDVSSEASLGLRNSGAGERVLNSMLSRNRAIGQDGALPPSEPGLYLKTNGKWADLMAENVNFRSSFLMPVTRTGSVTKSRLAATADGPKSTLRLPAGAEFFLVCANETTAADYSLLRAEAGAKDKRQYRVEFVTTSGMLTAVGGNSKNTIPIESERVAPRTYRLKLPALETGEYGFLPPAAAVGVRVGSLGKIYSFGVE